MDLFRITTTKWAGKLTGSGFPARWNSKGVYILYTASSRALACLENLVHRSGEGLNRNFKITVIRVPDNCTIETISSEELPKLWYKKENTHHCRIIGDGWFNNGKSLLLQVPSAIIREETNVLINPNHPEIEAVSVSDIVDFEFDERL